MTDDALLTHLHGALADLRDRWRKSHGVVVAELELRADGHGGVWVGGTVLVPSQRAALDRSLRTAMRVGGFAEDRLTMAVEALTEATDALWLRPSGASVDIHAAPDGDLASQWAHGEPPLRFLAASKGWLAVETADRTVGWAAADELDEVAADPTSAAALPASVAAWRSEWAGRARAATPTDWLRALLPWLGSPYRLGGRMLDGLDCSALTQHLYRAALGIGLPRHSSDQTRFGARVPREQWAPGDLLLLHHLERGISHTALLLPDADWVGRGLLAVGQDRAIEAPSTDLEAPLSVAHASRDHGAVIVEPLEDFLQRYGLRAARRFPPGTVPLPTGERPATSNGASRVLPGGASEDQA